MMILDGAGWHKSQSMLVPSNIRLINLPPYSPELNPVEHLWDELREKHFHNHAFDSLNALEDQLVTGLLALENNAQRVSSICNWDWTINAASNAKENKLVLNSAFGQKLINLSVVFNAHTSTENSPHYTAIETFPACSAPTAR